MPHGGQGVHISHARYFLERHLRSVFDGDIAKHHAATPPGLTLYEWVIRPHRVDGLPFHDAMLEESGHNATSGPGLVSWTKSASSEKPLQQNFDRSKTKQQRCGKTAIYSYFPLVSQDTQGGVEVQSIDENRGLFQKSDGWQVVHVHKSPSWKAAYQAPARYFTPANASCLYATRPPPYERRAGDSARACVVFMCTYQLDRKGLHGS